MTGAANAWLDGRHILVVGSQEAADIVAGGLAQCGGRVVRSEPGFVDLPEIAQAFDRAEAQAGRGIDILVHAGTEIANALPETIDLPQWRATQSADIDGRFLHAAEFTRRRLAAKQGGAILFLMPSPAIAAGRVAAATANGALENLVKSLAVEWARDGIRINAIASRIVERPGVATDAHRASLANLAAYLVSLYGAYVTGTVMGIDEG